jgi:hypothetical protein
VVRPVPNAPNIRDGGFTAAFAAVQELPCRACAVAPLVEYNYLLNLNRQALAERLGNVVPSLPWIPA